MQSTLHPQLTDSGGNMPHRDRFCGSPVTQPESDISARSNSCTDAFLAHAGATDLPLARKWMCTKLRARGVPEPVVAAFNVVPRHAFAPPLRWRVAYLDLDLWTGVTWMTAPLTVARALEAIPLLSRATRI